MQRRRYTVVELAGYVGENDRRSFETYIEAVNYMTREYSQPESEERERLKPDIALDIGEERTYDF